MPVDLNPFASVSYGGGSPGSMVSDTRSTASGSDGDALPSPTNSVVSLPPAHSGYGLKSWIRRTSVSSLLNDGSKTRLRGAAGSEVDELEVALRRSLYVSSGAADEEVMVDDDDEGGREDERYLSLDDI
jgi:hypothetical protein